MAGRKALFGALLLGGLFGISSSQAVTYEAEDATLNGVTVGTSQAGFSGVLKPDAACTSVRFTN
jgi:uncharacterized protein YdbL (DUF1318 family)